MLKANVEVMENDLHLQCNMGSTYHVFYVITRTHVPAIVYLAQNPKT